MRKLIIKTYPGFPVLFFLSLLFSLPAFSQSAKNAGRYHNHEQLTAVMKELQQKNSGIITIHNLATSPGKRQLLLYEIGTEINTENKLTRQFSSLLIWKVMLL